MWAIRKCICTTRLYKEGLLNAVIEIPAGTSGKIEYDTATGQFTPNERNGRDRIIEYLPYPANYGFIPGTLSDHIKGGDGDALDIVVLCPSLETGTILTVIPIGMLHLEDSGERDVKILAIPADRDLQTITARSLSDLQQRYPEVTKIVVAWFLNYEPSDKTIIKSASDEKSAVDEITRNLKLLPGEKEQEGVDSSR